ncbi:hypothetical protein RF11_00288 [Thelohanellus kitauei]|uniref:Uncharacterized protein n=1 Tax=Thelohanellus kitauei TaxID=669202 RepID=A0A0C2MF57_THEKT|nr:hypothetical protein RF11_00288 [Thelohanellus kitauei]
MFIPTTATTASDCQHILKYCPTSTTVSPYSISGARLVPGSAVSTLSEFTTMCVPGARETYPGQVPPYTGQPMLPQPYVNPAQPYPYHAQAYPYPPQAYPNTALPYHGPPGYPLNIPFGPP